MFDKFVDDYPHALKFVPDCYITQNVCNNAFNTYNSKIWFVPAWYKTQEMLNKAVDRCFPAFIYILDLI